MWDYGVEGDVYTQGRNHCYLENNWMEDKRREETDDVSCELNDALQCQCAIDLVDVVVVDAVCCDVRKSLTTFFNNEHNDDETLFTFVIQAKYLSVVI